MRGVSKKSGNAYDFIQVHYNGKSRGVEGQATLTLSLDPADYPMDSVILGGEYNVEFDNRGYIQEYLMVQVCIPWK
ncbi:MAG: hypothetical protein VB071_12865 [Lawsonibacter sp.]|nr:hypothetical protein [Lawsonibacter sp.]